MLVAFAFGAKPGKAKDLGKLLADEETARRVTELLGARRNVLFMKDGRMVRILEFDDDADKPSMYDLAHQHAWFHEFLAEVGRLAEGGFDVDDEDSFEAFNEQVFHPLVYDIET